VECKLRIPSSRGIDGTVRQANRRVSREQPLLRQGLKSLLEREKFQVMAEASDGHDAVRLTQTLQPDIAVLDISMPTLNGIDAARELGRSCPKTKAILLTQHEEEQYIHEALEAGVKGYVLKNQVASDLIHAIQQVSRGEFYVSCKWNCFSRIALAVSSFCASASPLFLLGSLPQKNIGNHPIA